MDRAFRASTRLLGAVTVVVGVALVVVTIARGGGPLAAGVLIGVAFAALGAIRYAAATGKGG